MQVAVRTCPSCKTEKSLSDFYNDASRSSGKSAYCAACTRDRWEAWKKENPERNRVVQARNVKKSTLKKFYGLTIEQWQGILDSQQGVCAIEGCGSDKKLAVDHDHACCPEKFSCGKCIRGIICSECNLALGKIKDSTERLKGMIKYLGGR